MISKELNRIQKELKAPKGQYNNFGKYKYRSCEDILEGVKKVLGDCSIVLNDSPVLVGDRIYINATATLILGDEKISVNAFAREPLTKKGMDDSQITGTASSYARKYALNGLFAIDDTKDADSQDNRDSSPQKPTKEITDGMRKDLKRLMELSGQTPSEQTEKWMSDNKNYHAVEKAIKDLQSKLAIK